ncbi:MAG: DUF167 domain-containing protein [Candidatus Riflebacteria bacterium]|nr:DUF167 domain-containing protein [Candidatus Riflebacteria bacterium]
MLADVCIKQTPEGSVIMVLAVARSSRTEIVDLHQERCRIKVKAAPVDGEANAALVSFLAKTFGLAKSRVSLKQGQTSKQKAFLLRDLDARQAIEVLQGILSMKER